MDTGVQLVAKFQCRSVDSNEYSERVTLQPVWSPDKTSANYNFWKATPNGHLEMYIDNPDAQGVFKVGTEYLIQFSEA